MTREDPERQDLEALVSDLVSIETENPPGNEQPGSEFVRDWFRDRDVDAQLVHDPFEDRPQVVAEVGEGEPTVVLNGHIDVFPAGDRSRWTHDPYGGEIEDGQLYGRGSVDMKTGVALGMLATARAQARDEKGELDGRVLMHLAVGEESGEPGTQRLVERGNVGDYGVVLEPTSMVSYTSTKGLAWYRITVSGEPSHAAYPDQGDNAILHALPVFEALQGYDERVRERVHPFCGREYASITQLNAGTKENVIPESTDIVVDRRFSPDRSIEDVDAEIEELLADVAEAHDVDVEWERTRLYESAETDPDNVAAEVFRERSSAAADVPTDPAGSDWSCDFRNLVNEGDMTHSIVWGPDDVTQAGTFDEHADLDEAETGLEVLTSAVDDLLRRGPP
jgi:succinyl-diaminopimelate desuccinylase